MSSAPTSVAHERHVGAFPMSGHHVLAQLVSSWTEQSDHVVQTCLFVDLRKCGEVVVLVDKHIRVTDGINVWPKHARDCVA